MNKDNLKPCKHYIYYKVQNYYFGECDMCDEEKDLIMKKVEINKEKLIKKLNEYLKLTGDNWWAKAVIISIIDSIKNGEFDNE